MGAHPVRTPVPSVQSFKKEDIRQVGDRISVLSQVLVILNYARKSKEFAFLQPLAYWLSFLIPFVLFVIGAMLNRRRE